MAAWSHRGIIRPPMSTSLWEVRTTSQSTLPPLSPWLQPLQAARASLESLAVKAAVPNAGLCWMALCVAEQPAALQTLTRSVGPELAYRILRGSARFSCPWDKICPVNLEKKTLPLPQAGLMRNNFWLCWSLMVCFLGEVSAPSPFPWNLRSANSREGDSILQIV